MPRGLRLVNSTRIKEDLPQSTSQSAGCAGQRLWPSLSKRISKMIELSMGVWDLSGYFYLLLLGNTKQNPFQQVGFPVNLL
jgi:hypothetical protein